MNNQNYGQLATTPEQMAQNRANLQTSLAGLGTNSSIVNNNVVPLPQTLNSNNLTNTTAYNLPANNYNPTTGPLAVANNSAVSEITSSANYIPPAPVVNPEKAKNATFLNSILEKINGQANDIYNINNDSKLADKKQKATAISTEIDTMDKAYRDQIQTIKANSGGKSAQGIQTELAQAEDRYQNNRANVALVYKVANEDYQGAQEIVNQKVQSLKDQNSQALESYRLAADSIQNDLTESEKIQLQNQLSIKASKNKSIEDTYNSVLRNAVQNKAPASVLAQIDAARNNPNATPATILSAAGNYGVDVAQQLDNQYKQTQINNMQAQAKQATAALPGPTQTRVQSVAGQFDSEQAVKNYQTIAETVSAVKTAGVSPTDDIQRIYAIAKVLDPNSAVREGEYKTVQDYATSLLQRAGLKAKRVFENTGFLTTEARNFINSTLDNRLASSKKAYDNIYNSYGSRIDKITGQKDGTDYITNYAAAFNSSNTGAPAGKEIESLRNKYNY